MKSVSLARVESKKPPGRFKKDPVRFIIVLGIPERLKKGPVRFKKHPGRFKMVP